MLIDQSTSMSRRLGDGQTKAAFLADVINKTIYALVINCTRSDGVRDYFQIGLIAYSGTDARNAFSGPLVNDTLPALSRVAGAPLRIEDRMKKVVTADDQVAEQSIRFPIWIDARSQGKTSMCSGLTRAIDLLRGWCEGHSKAFPPIVLHVTDGHPTDGNPEPLADELKRVSTQDGPCLLFNLHVDTGGGVPITFPSDERVLKDRFAKTLFRMSSELPEHVLRAARAKGYDIRTGARGFIFNASAESIVDFFEIGTRPMAIDR
jgi:hypothetical protein